MTPGQTRVLVLLGILFVLEMSLQPNIKTWLQSMSNGITSGITSALTSSSSLGSVTDLLKSPNNTNPPPTNNYGNKKGWINPNSDGSCASGTSPIHVSNGKLACQYN